MTDLEEWEQEEARRVKRHGRLLVVDDDEDVRDSIQRFLALEGYDATTAESGAAALERARTLHFDLVITDLKMPGMSGIDTLIALKRLRADLPVILLTGYASPETASSCMREGAYDYLTKPVELDQLLAVVESALREGKAPSKG